MKVNDIIKCSVIGYQDYGVFVKCPNDYSGLVHISEISEQFVSDVSDIFEIGDLLTLKILEIDDLELKLKLSYKKAHKVHRRILRNVKIVKGFNSLANNLDKWTEIKLKEYNYDKRNKNK